MPEQHTGVLASETSFDLYVLFEESRPGRTLLLKLLEFGRLGPGHSLGWMHLSAGLAALFIERCL